MKFYPQSYKKLKQYISIVHNAQFIPMLLIASILNSLSLKDAFLKGNYVAKLKKKDNVFLPYLKISDLLPETHFFFLFGLTFP